MATTYNLYIDQGTTFSANLTVTDATGTVRNITDFTPRSQLRRSFESANATSFTVTIPTGTDGVIRLQLPAATSSNLKYGRYFYDIEIESSSNVIERVFEGIVELNPEVTK